MSTTPNPTTSAPSEFAVQARKDLAGLSSLVDGNAAWLQICETVNEIGINCWNPGTGQVLADALHGKFGAQVSSGTWDVFARGFEQIPFEVEGPPEDPYYQSFAAICLDIGGIAALRTVVKSGIPDVIQGPLRPSTVPEFLRLLCSTQTGREHPSFSELDGLACAVDMAVMVRSGDVPHGYEALELVLEIDPDDAEFHELVADDSASGAYVREFLLRRGIDAVANGAGEVPQSSSLPRRNRKF